MFGKVFKPYVPSLILGLVLVIDTFVLPQAFFHGQKWMMLLFFVILYSVTEKINNFGLRDNPQKFHIFFFSAMIIRMILSIVFIFVFVYSEVENLLLFTATFFIFYFYYIVFDIYYLLGNLRAD